MKLIYLSLKCRQLLGDFVRHITHRVRPQAPTEASPLYPTGDVRNPDPLFCALQKILKLYCASSDNRTNHADPKAGYETRL